MPEGRLTKEQAIAPHESRFWEGMGHRERAEFQLHAKLLCMPFGVLHEAVEKTLGRPVFTQEFGSLGIEGLKAELRGEKPAPTFEEIVGLIPEDKRVVLVAAGEDDKQ